MQQKSGTYFLTNLSIIISSSSNLFIYLFIYFFLLFLLSLLLYIALDYSRFYQKMLIIFFFNTWWVPTVPVCFYGEKK